MKERMKRRVTNLLFACAAIAAANHAVAAPDEGMQQYRESLAGARATYESDLAQCKQMRGEERDLCTVEAKAAHKKANAEAIAHHRNTPEARVDARIAAADADYDVARARCKAQRGNERDVCMQRARAERVAATADAKSDLRVTQARNKAKEEKRKAYYRAEREKCDALAGAAKQACISLARSRYGE
jgi:hypothetical protein